MPFNTQYPPNTGNYLSNLFCNIYELCCQMPKRNRTFSGNIIVDHSDVVGASRCSNYIVILNLTSGVEWLDNCKDERETLKFWDLVHLILKLWWYMSVVGSEIWNTGRCKLYLFQYIHVCLISFFRSDPFVGSTDNWTPTCCTLWLLDLIKSLLLAYSSDLQTQEFSMCTICHLKITRKNGPS